MLTLNVKRNQQIDFTNSDGKQVSIGYKHPISLGRYKSGMLFSLKDKENDLHFCKKGINNMFKLGNLDINIKLLSIGKECARFGIVADPSVKIKLNK